MFKAKKLLGQNFLINPGVLDKIVGAIELDKSDTVLEIGPGTGILTEKLSEKAGKIVAVEKDRRLIEGLVEKFSAKGGSAFGGKNSNVEIIEGDILKLDIKELFRNSKLEIINPRYKVVGNIPYYITSHLLRKIFESWPRPKLIVLTVQKEVAQRILAKPPHMNMLALSVQLYAEPKIISHVSRGSFRPIPKVDSAILRLTPHHASWTTKHETKEKFFKLIKTAFAGKRKQLVGNLSRNFDIMKEELSEIFNKLNIRPDARAENLSLIQWLKLTEYLKKYLN